MEISLISQMFLPDSCGIDGEQMETLSDEKMPGLSKVLPVKNQRMNYRLKRFKNQIIWVFSVLILSASNGVVFISPSAGVLIYY